MVGGGAHMHAECAACGILKVERVLDARLEKLIGMLYLKLGRSAVV